MGTFGFQLRQIVKMVESSETGTIIGRAEYTDSANAYYVRYKDGAGRQVDAWFMESAIEAA